MAVTTYPELRIHFRSIFTNYAGTIAWPDSDFTPPTASNDPSAPSSYIVPDISVSSGTTIDTAGGAEIDGNVTVDCWAEKRHGDGTVMQMVETLRTLFNTYADHPGTGETGSVTFLEPRLGDSRLLGDTATWFGRRVTFPFTWLRP